ncbi:MAG: phosphotransferase [Thermomicrobiales bacterium]
MQAEMETLLEEMLPGMFHLRETPEVSLIRAYTNDVYRVVVGDRRFALKVYGQGWRTDSEISYELDLLRHLAGKGIAVAQAVSGHDGESLRHLQLGGGVRQAVLFHWAPGTKPDPPFTQDVRYREGAAVAALHAASDDFVSAHARRPLDGVTLIEPVRTAVLDAENDGPAGIWLDRFGRKLGIRLSQVAAEGLDWGPCHGDLTFDNLHVTEHGGFVWYDFDSGGPGWRAIDLQGWAALDPAMQEWQDAFIAGYRTVRLLDDRDVAASPLLAAAEEYRGIGIDLAYRVRQRGPDVVADYLEEAVVRMDRWRRVLDLGSW